MDGPGRYYVYIIESLYTLTCYIMYIYIYIYMFKVRESRMLYVVTYMQDLKNQISEYHKNVIDSQIQRTN